MPNFFNIGEKLSERNIVAVLSWLHLTIIPDATGEQDAHEWYFLHSDIQRYYPFVQNM